jgi:hypothetical protein
MSLPKGLGLFATFLGKDANNDERPKLKLNFSSKVSSNSKMQAQIPHSARCSKYRKCGISPAVTSLPEASTFVECLHRAEYINHLNCINLKYKNP